MVSKCEPLAWAPCFNILMYSHDTCPQKLKNRGWLLRPLPPPRSWLTYSPRAGLAFFSGCHQLRFSALLEHIAHIRWIFLQDALENLPPQCLAHMMLAWHFCHICSASLYLFGMSTWQCTLRFPGCITGQVPAWTGLRKDPTRIAKGGVSGALLAEAREKTHVRHLLSISWEPYVSSVLCCG